MRTLVQALHDLYRRAGMPSTRTLSASIRDDDASPDTVSHELVGRALHGRGLPTWPKLESMVRGLARLEVTGQLDLLAEIRRFHRLWLAAFDAQSPADVVPARSQVGPGPAGSGRPARPQPASERVCNLPARNSRFCGRAAQLVALEEMLRVDGVSPWSAAVLHGGGGCGKTQLALEYAHRHMNDYDVIWWSPAEQPSDLRASLWVLAQRLQLSVGLDLSQVVKAVVDRLEESRERWLLVFDNVDEIGLVQSEIPALGGHVIVTTRNPSAGFFGHALAVRVFQRSESVEYLRLRDTSLSVADANLMAERLGDLPLALAQVAAVREATRMPLARYLALFDGHVQELLALDRPADYPRGVAAAVELAVAQVYAATPMAAEVLQLFAHFGPEPVPMSLLRSGGSADLSPLLSRCLQHPFRLETALHDLARFGLVVMERDTARASVHRVVRDCLRQTMSAADLENGADNVHALLAAANPGAPDRKSTRELHSQIAPHVIPTQIMDSPYERRKHVVIDQIRYLYQVGDYEGSSRLARAARERWSDDPERGGLGPEHELTILATRHEANALRATGDLHGSKKLTDELLARLRDSPQYGEDDALTLYVALSEGVDLLYSGEWQAALEAEQGNLERSRRVHGDDHPRTLNIQMNAGLSLRMLGRFAEALECDAAVLAKRSTLEDTYDSLIVGVELNAIWDLHGLGRYDEMLGRVSVLAGTSSSWGRPGHSHTLQLARAEAVALRCADRLTEAMDGALAAYAQHVRYLGERHVSSLSMKLSYINILHGMGQDAMARGLAAEALEGHREQFGRDHPLTLAASVILAMTQRSMGEVAAAREVDGEAYRRLVRLLGEHHPFTLCAANGLAGDHVGVGDAGLAIPLMKSVLAGVRRCGRNLNQPFAQVVEHNLALLRRAQDGRSGRVGGVEPLAGSWREVWLEPPPLT